MRVVAPSWRPLVDALALAPALLDRAADGNRVITASFVEGPAVVLGALQHAGHVVDLDACEAKGVPVLRRCTTGTAAYIGHHAIIWTLVLPHVAALHPDATPRTLLNRNVRGFLRGLSRGGAPAQYFGREWIAIHHRPAALLGFEALPDGRIVIEIFAGFDRTLALPAVLAAAEERALDRWRGKEPLALGPHHPAALAFQVINAVSAHAKVGLEVAELPKDLVRPAPIQDPRSPVPLGLTIAAPRRAPIGWIEAAADPASKQLWIGGDALVPTFAVGALTAALTRGEAPAPGDAPIDGATWDDLIAAGRAALG